MNFLVFPESKGTQVAINVAEITKVVYHGQGLTSKLRPLARNDARIEFHVRGESAPRTFSGREAEERWGTLQAIGALGLPVEA